MEYVFGEKSASYWWRVACIVGGLFLIAQLPLLFGKIDGEAGGFMVVGNTMGRKSQEASGLVCRIFRLQF